MLVIDFPFCLSKVFALYTSQTCIEPFLLGCYFSVATCFFVVTECVENAGVWMRFAVLPEAIWNWLGRSRPIFFFFYLSFLIQKMFALTLIPRWKHYFIMTQWINIHWEPWTMIGGLTIVWKASLVWVEMRLLCETFFLSKRTI